MAERRLHRNRTKLNKLKAVPALRTSGAVLSHEVCWGKASLKLSQQLGEVLRQLLGWGRVARNQQWFPAAQGPVLLCVLGWSCGHGTHLPEALQQPRGAACLLLTTLGLLTALLPHLQEEHRWTKRKGDGGREEVGE